MSGCVLAEHAETGLFGMLRCLGKTPPRRW